MMKRRRWPLLPCLVMAIGCSGGHPSRPDLAPDLLVTDLAAHGRPPDGGAPCGAVTCLQTQLCVHPCQPGVGCDLRGSGTVCIAPFCMDIPAACPTNPTCACVGD